MRKKEPDNIPNVISDHTGQFDARFLLWRAFCEENGIAVDTLPGDLTGENRQKWEALKKDRLRKTDRD